MKMQKKKKAVIEVINEILVWIICSLIILKGLKMSGTKLTYSYVVESASIS